MSELVNRQDVIDAICDEYCGGWQDCKYYPKCENLKAIQNLPSAQPEVLAHGEGELSAEPERKKGKWLCNSYGIIFKRRIWRCSVCGNLLDFDGVNAGRGDANFCPNCGARMDAQEQEGEG